MELKKLKKCSEYQWMAEPYGKMRVPVRFYGDRRLIEEMDEKVLEQASNVTMLPGIVGACHVMPDAHWGYGFPIGGVAAFDPDKGGIISAGGVGFDISCGVRTITTGLDAEEVQKRKGDIASLLSRKIPAGVGSTGKLSLSPSQMDDMLTAGARWAVEQGYGHKKDLDHIEEHGAIAGAKPKCVSDHAKKRQKQQVGTLGSGNHYLEIQRVSEVFNEKIAQTYGLVKGQIVITIHCGSRGLGHQIGTEFLKRMVTSAPKYNLDIPDRELACAPIDSSVGRDYLGAMRAGINCALANRQVLTHLLRQAFGDLFPRAQLKLLYDVSHNTCKEETHRINGKPRRLFVHRKGATRAFGPGYEKLPPEYKDAGQPVIIGGTMGTASYILAGTKESLGIAMGSACHGAGRSMSRRAATKKWRGSDVMHSLAAKGIIIKSPSLRGVAEEAPEAYKDVTAVVEATHQAKLSIKVAKLTPIVCIKG